MDARDRRYTTFFLGSLTGMGFFFYHLHGDGKIVLQIGSLWTTPWPDQIFLFVKIKSAKGSRFLTYIWV